MADALKRFHEHRKIFQACGVRPDGFSLPRQHSLVHYESSIRAFGAPNGVCSSITESKHIKAVKEPWRRSNRFNPLGQILLTNQRLDKLAASRVDFKDRGMLDGTIMSNKLHLHALRKYYIKLRMEIVSRITAIEPANDPNGPQDVALRTGSDHDDGASGERDEVGVVHGPTVLAHVDLAKTVGTLRAICLTVG